MGRCKEGMCNHFTGVMDKKCAAGVDYREIVGGEDRGWGLRLPCMGDKDGVVHCDLLQLPTAEEIKRSEAESKARMARMGAARGAIIEHIGPYVKKERNGAAGSIPCPNCEGVLHYSRSGYNGHIHAQCTTAGCAKWME